MVVSVDISNFLVHIQVSYSALALFYYMYRFCTTVNIRMAKMRGIADFFNICFYCLYLKKKAALVTDLLIVKKYFEYSRISLFDIFELTVSISV